MFKDLKQFSQLVIMLLAAQIIVWLLGGSAILASVIAACCWICVQLWKGMDDHESMDHGEDDGRADRLGA